MTDKDIIKALGLCTSEHLGCEDGCPYIPTGMKIAMGEDACETALLKDARDLINRQQAEIEYLKKVIETMTNEQILSATEAKKEIDRLIDEIDELNIKIAKLYFEKDKAKVEAVKEFMQKIEDECEYVTFGYSTGFRTGDVRKIYKERVGDAE